MTDLKDLGRYMYLWYSKFVFVENNQKRKENMFQFEKYKKINK